MELTVLKSQCSPFANCLHKITQQMLHKPNSQVRWVQIITWRASSAPYCSFLSSSCPFFPLHHHHPMKSNPKLSLTSQPSTECSTSRTPKLSSWTNKSSATRKGVTRRRWGERRSRTLEPGLSLQCYQRVLSLPLVHLGATMTTPSRKLYIVPSPTQNLESPISIEHRWRWVCLKVYVLKCIFFISFLVSLSQFLSLFFKLHIKRVALIICQ